MTQLDRMWILWGIGAAVNAGLGLWLWVPLLVGCAAVYLWSVITEANREADKREQVEEPTQ